MRVQNDILDQVKREIDSSGYADKLRAGVVLTGGGATLKHIKELCQYTLQKPVRIGIPEFGFVRNIPNDLKHPMYSTALGLLKYGINKKEYAMETEQEEKPVVEERKTNPKPENPKPENSGKKLGNEGKNTSKPKNTDSKPWGSNFIMKKVQDFFEGLVDKTS